MTGGRTAGLTAWQLLFEYSPILFTGGVSPTILGGVLPIIAITEALNFPLGLLSGADITLDRMFAKYQVLPGTTFLNYELGRYPFANSTVAANATIKMPTMVSVIMICPAQNPLGMFEKLAIFEALTTVVDAHVLQGGTFTIATPSQIFTNCVFRGLRDASVGNTHQLQNAFQWDFEKPLLTASDAQEVMNSLMQTLQNGAQPIDSPGFSGIGSAVASPVSAAGSSTIPAAVTNLGANISAPTGVGIPQ